MLTVPDPARGARHNTRFPGLSIAPVAVAPVVAEVVGSIFGGAAQRRERNIQDRIQRWQNFPSSQLQDIIRQQGGEAGEAAARILAARGEPTTPAPPVQASSPVITFKPPTTTAPVTTAGVVERASIDPILIVAALGAALLVFGRR